MSNRLRQGRATGTSYIAPPPHRSWSYSAGEARRSLTPMQSRELQRRLWDVIDAD